MKTNKGSVSQFIGSCAALLPRAWAVLILAVAVAVEAGGVTLKVDRIKQRYPWNGLVDIDYTLAYDEGEAVDRDDNLEVMMVDNAVAPAETNRAITFLQAPLPMTAGQHRITWNASADGVTNYTEQAEFLVKIAHYAEVYMVIDLLSGKDSAGNVCYHVDFLSGTPSGGFNKEEYKSSKIVLRRIHPCSYLAGSPAGTGGEANRNSTKEKQHGVILSQPYYIGLFEVTQAQYKNVVGGNPSGFPGLGQELHPVENLDYGAIRGSTATTANPPTQTSFMGLLCQRCKSSDKDGNYVVDVTGFDLPTEFQWEYACRAGTAKAFNRTDDFDNTDGSAQKAELELLGRYKDNGGSADHHAAVGSYQSNAWGLYDMHGNVQELCRDLYCDDPTTLNQVVNPTGAASDTRGVARGGGYSSSYDGCRSAFRNDRNLNGKNSAVGFRLSRTLP